MFDIFIITNVRNMPLTMYVERAERGSTTNLFRELISGYRRQNRFENDDNQNNPHFEFYHGSARKIARNVMFVSKFTCTRIVKITFLQRSQIAHFWHGLHAQKVEHSVHELGKRYVRHYIFNVLTFQATSFDCLIIFRICLSTW